MKQMSQFLRQNQSLVLRVSVVLAALATQHALANTGGGGGAGLPWETPLKTIQQSLSGPVALAISIISMAITGAVLVFGGELTDFAKRACYVVLAVSFLMLGNQFVTTLFNSGSLI